MSGGLEFLFPFFNWCYQCSRIAFKMFVYSILKSCIFAFMYETRLLYSSWKIVLYLVMHLHGMASFSLWRCRILAIILVPLTVWPLCFYKWCRNTACIFYFQVSFCTNPVWLIKTRLQLQNPLHQTRQYSGVYGELYFLVNL